MTGKHPILTTANNQSTSDIVPVDRKHKVDVRLCVMGISAKDLSRFWGCTPQQFLYWAKSDHRDVKPETIERLAEMLGVPEDFLSDPTWEGLFSPMPAWLLDEMRDEVKTKIVKGLATKTAK